MKARRLEVDDARIDGWASGFEARHAEVVRQDADDVIVLTAADGSTATLEPLCPNGAWSTSLAAWAAHPASVALVLVRRGGYAVGLAQGASLVAHKAGTRYVQSRTAAGGWSQQRFARRRGNQADALVGAVAEHAHRLLADARPGALVLGGDKALTAQVLQDARLAALRTLPQRGMFDLGDPRLSVLQEALRRGRSVRILLQEKGSPSSRAILVPSSGGSGPGGR